MCGHKLKQTSVNMSTIEPESSESDYEEADWSDEFEEGESITDEGPVV